MYGFRKRVSPKGKRKNATSVIFDFRGTSSGPFRRPENLIFEFSAAGRKIPTREFRLRGNVRKGGKKQEKREAKNWPQVKCAVWKTTVTYS